MEIRKLEFADLEFFNKVRNEYAMEYLHDSRIFTLQQTIEWFNNTRPDFYLIEENSEKIGYFRLSNYSEINKYIYVGADIDKKFIGKKLGYKAYNIFIPFLFKTYKLNKISLEVLSTNTVALNLYKKLGFIYEGEKREEVFKNGIFINSILMSILKKEYERTN